MHERDEVVEELKHLLQYYRQAAHEFFDEVSSEVDERARVIYGCLEKNRNSLDEYRKMVAFLVTAQGALKKRVDDLTYLTDRMSTLLKAP